MPPNVTEESGPPRPRRCEEPAQPKQGATRCSLSRIAQPRYAPIASYEHAGWGARRPPERGRTSRATTVPGVPHSCMDISLASADRVVRHVGGHRRARQERRSVPRDATLGSTIWMAEEEGFEPP